MAEGSIAMSKNSSGKMPNAVLVAVQLPETSDLEHRSSLEELARLVQTLGLNVVASVSQKRSSPSASTVVGEGKLLEVAKWTGGPGFVAGFSKHTSQVGVNEVSDEDYAGIDDDFSVDAPNAKAEYVVFDNELTPTQSKNLEDALGVEVMDRTGVIVEIFHRHAKTPAAKAQVEIARLTYLTPRIRVTGGGDRQGGGIGAKGAGETQHELDRRRIRDRIAELRSELESIHRDEALRRERRREQMKVALVGYTNAGKSSLMRALTGSEVLVADKLFATLDTTVRTIYPETKPKILVSDTVGFIKKLPHDLVASFRSTLDEALDASLLLYVVDAADPSFRLQLETTKTVLREIGADESKGLLILNKDDKLSEIERAALRREFPDAVFLSTRNPSSVENLRDICVAYFEKDMIEGTVVVPYAKGAAVAEFHQSMRVLSESHDEGGTTLKVRGFTSDLERIKKQYGLT